LSGNPVVGFKGWSPQEEIGKEENKGWERGRSRRREKAAR